MKGRILMRPCLGEGSISHTGGPEPFLAYIFKKCLLYFWGQAASLCPEPNLATKNIDQ